MSCGSGEQPSNEEDSRAPCEPCAENQYSFGVQTLCQPCSLQAEFNQTSLYLSLKIDAICEDSHLFAEVATDTIRQISEETGLSMSSVAILLTVCIPVFLVLNACGLACLIHTARKNRLCCCRRSVQPADETPKQVQPATAANHTTTGVEMLEDSDCLPGLNAFDNEPAAEVIVAGEREDVALHHTLDKSRQAELQEKRTSAPDFESLEGGLK